MINQKKLNNQPDLLLNQLKKKIKNKPVMMNPNNTVNPELKEMTKNQLSVMLLV